MTEPNQIFQGLGLPPTPARAQDFFEQRHGGLPRNLQPINALGQTEGEYYSTISDIANTQTRAHQESWLAARELDLSRYDKLEAELLRNPDAPFRTRDAYDTRPIPTNREVIANRRQAAIDELEDQFNGIFGDDTAFGRSGGQERFERAMQWRHLPPEERSADDSSARAENMDGPLAVEAQEEERGAQSSPESDMSEEEEPLVRKQKVLPKDEVEKQVEDAESAPNSGNEAEEKPTEPGALEERPAEPELAPVKESAGKDIGTLDSEPYFENADRIQTPLEPRPGQPAGNIIQKALEWVNMVLINFGV